MSPDSCFRARDVKTRAEKPRELGCSAGPWRAGPAVPRLGAVPAPRQLTGKMGSGQKSSAWLQEHKWACFPAGHPPWGLCGSLRALSTFPPSQSPTPTGSVQSIGWAPRLLHGPVNVPQRAGLLIKRLPFVSRAPLWTVSHMATPLKNLRGRSREPQGEVQVTSPGRGGLVEADECWGE